MFHRPRVLVAASLCAIGLAFTGCAASPTLVAATHAASPATTGPLTIDNCGTKVTFTAAPRRVVTIKSTSLDMMLALGLGDRVVGTAFADGPEPAPWAAEASRLPVLSDQVPSSEAVLKTTPDFVYAGWESNFSADGAGVRSTLQGMGVNTYVSPSACKEPAYQPKRLSYDDIFGEMTQVAAIFHTDAGPLIAKQKKILAAIPHSTKKLTALWYSSGGKIPYVGAGIGAPQLVMNTLGLTNVAAGVHDTWTPMSWEAIVAANPDVIVLVDASWSTAVKKIAMLEANPATAGLTAVKDKRYLVIPFAASEAGVRTIPAAADLAAQLAKLEGAK